MRYRRLSYRYMVVGSGQTWPFGELWERDRLRLLVEPRWRPDTDTYETATTVEIIVDLAGVDEDDFEVQLFEDALIVEEPSTRRRASARALSTWSCPCRRRWTRSEWRRATIEACSASGCRSASVDGSPARS
jgi:hypothetical protein